MTPTIEHRRVTSRDGSAEVLLSRFRGRGQVAEYHFLVRPLRTGDVEAQLESVGLAYCKTLEDCGLTGDTAVLRRFFCSDLANQAALLDRSPYGSAGRNGTCAISRINQPPEPPAKVALWAYHVSDPRAPLQKRQDGPVTTLERGALAHSWATGLTPAECGASSEQTRSVLDQYESLLTAQHVKLADNVLRTWFFVQNIDANYHGLVEARREFFKDRGLTPQSHFIASTGVEGTGLNLSAHVVLDAYAIAGLRPEQVRHLAAPEYLSPTHIYGVTFERATAVTYADRRHILISGTASIDCEGRILHPGDVKRQLDRALENVEALLTRADATLRDMALFIVYVRDANDREQAARWMRQRFGDVPMLVVLAPVCRPGWLIEVEGLAITSATEPALPAF